MQVYCNQPIFHSLKLTALDGQLLEQLQGMVDEDSSLGDYSNAFHHPVQPTHYKSIDDFQNLPKLHPEKIVALASYDDETGVFNVTVFECEASDDCNCEASDKLIVTIRAVSIGTAGRLEHLVHGSNDPSITVQYSFSPNIVGTRFSVEIDIDEMLSVYDGLLRPIMDAIWFVGETMIMGPVRP